MKRKIALFGYGVIPETIDAIRALLGIGQNPDQSILKTNQSLGISR